MFRSFDLHTHKDFVSEQHETQYFNDGDEITKAEGIGK
jgi:hypothetical protein